MTNPSANYEIKKRIVQAGESRICKQLGRAYRYHATGLPRGIRMGVRRSV